MADDDPTEQHAANAQSNTAKLDVADKQPDDRHQSQNTDR
ncbi:Uncharacterised protein [Escherichia coli]|uniref:Uncharacterized protein n=1 Tax=Escherichia coli TaxID=562 RepID=A0A376VTG2_ECOLX|nr:hypothetical protein ExPCM14_02505 [Escherichia coli]STJ15066.1 Uncharacterised protein [Escherichia coli]